TVSGGVVELLLPVLRHHPDRQVTVWLEGLAHANDLMNHTVSQLMNNSVGVELTPRLEDVDLARLVERACAYYRRAAEDKSVKLIFSLHGDVRPVRTDRVLTAAVLDNLLSNAVKYSSPDRHIRVELHGERDGVREGKDYAAELAASHQRPLFRDPRAHGLRWAAVRPAQSGLRAQRRPASDPRHRGRHRRARRGHGAGARGDGRYRRGDDRSL